MARKKHKKSGPAGRQDIRQQAAVPKSALQDTPCIRPLHLALLSILAIALYANTLNAPFVWDEEPLITRNTLVHDLDYFLHPGKAKDHPHYDALAGRYVTYLSFALNYAIGGTSVTGYHVVNIAIHALNSVLVYLLVFMAMRTPFMQGSALKNRAAAMALLTGALFAAHPLMTEAVTYTFQRHASLVATFYILTVVLYSAARHKKSRALYIASIISAALAMKTKENAFTLPLIVALYEFMFFEGNPGKRLLRLLPILMTMSIVPLTMASLGAFSGGKAPVASEPLETAKHVLGRAEYFYSQMPVVAMYLRMLILPFGQSLDHGYNVYNKLSSLPVVLSLLLHMLTAGAGTFLWRISSPKRPEGRLIAFGILWFYIALAVESTFVPLQMIITEYRVYLPATGIFLAASTGGVMAAMRLESLRPGTFKTARNAAIALVAVLAILSIARNSTWRTELGIWQDASRKNPESTRPILHVGLAHEKLGDFNSALKAYQRTVDIDPNHHMAHYDVGVIYNKRGQYDKAEAAFRKSLSIRPGYAIARNNLAAVLMRTGRDAEAETELKRAIGLSPWDPNPYFNISLLLLKSNRYAEAEPYLERLKELVPPDADILNKLGIVYRETGKQDDAREAFAKGLRLSPDNYHLLLNMAVLEDRTGNRAEAGRLYRKMLSVINRALLQSPGDTGLIYFRTLAEQGIRSSTAP